MSKVRVFEVGPRDGLQNESRPIPFAVKKRFIQSLYAAGMRDLEIGLFVRGDRVPQMADSDRVVQHFSKPAYAKSQTQFWSLVPNQVGLERALARGATRLAIFTAATESFARRNIGMGLREAERNYADVIQSARAFAKRKGIELRIRGYLSTMFGCPFEGRVPPKKALKAVEGLLRIGVDEISIGDTIGVANPASVEAVIKPALKLAGAVDVAGHFHDTRGTALANALRSLELGVRTLDSSAGGLGGCPFAPGATGNLATEDLLYMLHGMGFKTGIDLEKVCKASLALSKVMRRPLASRFLNAYVSQKR